MKNRVQNESIESYSEFEKVFVDILNEHETMKSNNEKIWTEIKVPKNSNTGIIKIL